MDSLIAAAARALVAGDPLGALKHVALRNDAPALALRGIAMAQLGDHLRARDLLRRASRAFGAHEPLAQARCVVAGAEVSLALRDLGGSPRPLSAAARALDVRGDHRNAAQARLIGVRRLVLLGQLHAAEAALGSLDMSTMPPALRAVAELTAAELALRAVRTVPARAALDRASQAAAQSGVAALQAEVADCRAALDQPAARLARSGGAQPLRLDQVEALRMSGTLVLDACRHGIGTGADWVSLARRPVLFSLARTLAEAWPEDADRDALIATTFRTRLPDETHRARLRVEMGRLRALVKPLAQVEATAGGFRLTPLLGREVAVLTPPLDGDEASLLALLSDGAAWSTSALALALGTSQRSVQRALVGLEAAGRVRSVGRARAQRWLAPPLAGFTTILLLPAALAPA